MMGFTALISAMSALAALAVAQVRTIVPGETGALPDQGEWAWNLARTFVYPWNGSSAVAVGPHHLLAAGHTGNAESVVIGDNTYRVVEILTPPPDEGETDPPDLAFIRLDQPLPGFAGLYTPKPRAGARLYLLGFGVTGTSDGKTFKMGDQRPGLTWGTNRVGSVRRERGEFRGKKHSSQCIVIPFDAGDTPWEAGYGAYDSGGGTFIKAGHDWRLVGINASVDGDRATGLTGSIAVSVPFYAKWIEEQIRNG